MVADEQLVERVARGDMQALDALLARHERPLAHFLHRRTGGRDVEDLNQETWLRVVRHAPRFESDKRFRTWLYQIAVNVCRDWGRRQARSPQTADGVAEIAVTPIARADAALDAERLLACLPDEQREVVVLRYLRDVSVAEAAEILGCPQGTVKSRLHHAIVSLSGLIADEAEGTDDGATD